MFSKGITPKTVKDNVPSIISYGTQIVGDITTEGEVQIDGKVEGNIRCRSLIVADTGVRCQVVVEGIAPAAEAARDGHVLDGGAQRQLARGHDQVFPALHRRVQSFVGSLTARV